MGYGVALRYRAGRRCVLVAGIFGALIGGAAPAYAGEEAEKTEKSEKAGESRHGAVFVDPLGFLLFGPTLGVELAVGPISATVYGRWFNAGILANQLFTEDKNQFAFSYGAGLRARHYFGPRLEGFFAGVGVEYLRSSIEEPDALIVSKSQYLVPLAEGGYRLGWERFFLTGAVGLGYAFELSGHVENMPGGNLASAYFVKDKSSVYATASLELGVFF